MKAATYTRVSTQEQADTGTSLATQRERCRGYVESRGWTLAEEFEDAGVSGAKEISERPAFNELMQACRVGRVDVVVVTKLDRFSRSILHALQAFAELERFNVTVECTDEPNEPGLIRNIKLAVAEDERKRIAERMTLGRRAIAAKGYWTGGVVPYGFTVEPVKDTKHSRLIVHPDEAEVLRFAAAMLISGDTMTKVSDTLNGLDHRPRRARKWSYQLLRHTLSRPQLRGPILDDETFEQLQVVLDAGLKFAPYRERDKPYPLSGRLIGTCGAPYTGLYRRERDQRWYVCKNKRWTTRETRCEDPRLKADGIEQSVWWALLNFVGDEDALMEYAEREWFGNAAKKVATAEERQRAASRVRELEDRLARQVTLLLDEGLDTKAVASMSAQWNTELDAARRYLDEAERADAMASNRERHSDALRKAKTAFRMMSPSPEDQARLYELLDVKAQLTDEGTVIVTGELELMVEVLASGGSSPEELLGEMLSTSSRRSSSRGQAPASSAGQDRGRR
jgi:site-specific DNA recombinase